MEIVDIEKKYKLKRIQKKNRFYGTFFGSFSSIITLAILVIIAILIFRCIRNRRNQLTEGKGNTIVTYNTTPDRVQLTSTPNTTTTSVDSDEDGVEIRLHLTGIKG